MKKYIIIMAAAVAFMAATPVLCSDIPADPPADELPETLADEKKEITVLIEGVPRKMTVYDYLKGVVAAEMPVSFPEEALKAQAVAARTYIYYALDHYKTGEPIPECHRGAEFCDDFTHCQAYTEPTEECFGKSAARKIDDAVKATDGVIAVYDGEPIAAVFCSCAGGMTENSEDVWSGALPYLRSVISPGEEDCPKYSAELSMTVNDFKSAVAEAFPEARLSDEPSEWFAASERSPSGKIMTVKVGGTTVKGTEIRQALGLCSTNFAYKVSGDTVTFYTVGHGHGVGMSQYGAKYLAEAGLGYEEIIKWYYTGVSLSFAE